MAVMGQVRGGNGGGSKTLVDKGKITDVSSSTSYSFTADYDAILIVTYSVSNYDYRPVYDGVTYDWKFGNQMGAAVIIQGIKSGTTLTFNLAITCSIYGYKYE